MLKLAVGKTSDRAGVDRGERREIVPFLGKNCRRLLLLHKFLVATFALALFDHFWIIFRLKSFLKMINSWP